MRRDGRSYQELRPNLLSGAVSRLVEAVITFIAESGDVSAPGYSGRLIPHSGLVMVWVFGMSILTFTLSIAPVFVLGPDSALTQAIAGVLNPVLWPLILFYVVSGFLAQMYFLYAELKYRRYIITAEGVEYRDEFLDQSISTAEFRNVTDVSMERPVIQRLFGTGNVLLNTAGSSREEIKLRYLDNPGRIQEELSQRVRQQEYSQPA